MKEPFLYFVCVLFLPGYSVLALEPMEKSLPPEQLTEFIARWDAQVRQDVDKCLGLLSPFTAYSAEYDTFVLRNRDASVVDRLIALYIAEYQYWRHRIVTTFKNIAPSDLPEAEREQFALRRRTYEREKQMLEQSIARHGCLFVDFAMNGRWRTVGENELEYHDFLVSLAESTFDARIYEEVWEFPTSTKMRIAYLAEIEVEKTIERFRDAEVGFILNEKLYAPDTLFLSGNGAAISVQNAFQILRHVVERQPILAKQNTATILAFVRAYGLHYARMPGQTYKEPLDFAVRNDALHILKHIASREDIPLIQRLAEDAPTRRPPRFRTDSKDETSISELATLCAKTARSRTQESKKIGP